MDFTFYLVELLRLHDCVIVPDLGGFVSNYRPAEIDLVSNSFLPPVKEIIFTGKLSKNDGLLVNYISETEGIGYMEARQIISEFVDEVWSKLENGEKIEFPNLGSLHFDRNEKLIFEPALYDNFLLDAYGLTGFQFPQLDHNAIISSKRNFIDKEAVRPVLKSRKVIAMAAGLPLLLALIFIPVSKYSSKINSTAVFQSSSTASIPADKPAVTAAVTVRDTIGLMKTTVTSEPAPLQSTQNRASQTSFAGQPVGRYRIIGGCFKLRENAEKFLLRLRSDGFKSDLKALPNGTFLVVVQSYADKNEAALALKSLRQGDPVPGYFMTAN